MTLIKDETTARLDDLYRTGMEAIGLFEDLEERIPDADLRARVTAHTEAQRRLLDRSAELRRARGELPHAADPERSHLEAAGTFVRAMFLPGESSEAYIDSMLEAVAEVERCLDEALKLQLAPELRHLLESFKRDSDAFRHELRARL
jgi:hypothetical protein